MLATAMGRVRADHGAVRRRVSTPPPPTHTHIHALASAPSPLAKARPIEPLPARTLVRSPWPVI
eukprot:2517605-Prymnesium_polylepis.1